MSKNTKKIPETRIWIRLSDSDVVDKMKEDMKEYKTQSDYFKHILTVYGGGYRFILN
jgi:hypothetical protein